MSNKKILVTGGAGFIGSNLVKELVKKDSVTVIDDLSTGHIYNIQNLIDEQKITFVKGSVTDLDLLQESFKDVDFVFHLAAVSSVPKSIKDPVTTNAVNVNGMLNVLLAARDNNVKKVVYSSSCAVYGNPLKCPIKENTKTNPLSPYAASKLMGEYYCQVFTDAYDLNTVSLRYFNVYGPQQDPKSEYAAVIPK
ncbi:MAG: NAD-dependent epimerase/dehydratase family protein, partial [Candidatus Heimdallarchaeota archaeon]|nr:NAD-dependent epimerase/dehydratase family protein [Candidatus Heimdallarchaeota archaeon]MCK4877280.1 NAD-dependent epimerase/dehydratase family protein [Candidatus Heimdallarchaeota archaeon]